MSNRFYFPDQPHVEQIRERLWCSREFGRAAVMVGAGFSRNARRKSPSVLPFPLWKDLAKAMYESLYPLGTIPEGEREDYKLQLISSAGALRLAKEYEVTYTRAALDNLLLRAIPDNDYAPERLHELLLSIPWSDVFTTNYDTLLERSISAIHDRKYDLVLTPSDIQGAMKPRIVKLHGSFPSHRPFIITEEDYRSYPRRFAAFVNTVQQSIMENAFCLIGFSGDDPNFLFWSGWVRDNLGSAAPPIYLCSLFHISGPQRKLLEDRNVIPIDLSPVVSKINYPDREQSYTKALEWFLLNLLHGAPAKVMYWPTSLKVNRWKPSSEMPEIPTGPPPLPDPGPVHPSKGLLDAEGLKSLLVTWRNSREKYPGWIIAPRRNREDLWQRLKYWIDPVLDSIDNLPPDEQIYLLYELNWRMEITLTPLLNDWSEKITSIIERTNPFPEIVGMENAIARPDVNDYKGMDWSAVGMYWVGLVFTLARKAREDQDESRFLQWICRIEQVAKLYQEWQARWHYEKCLFYLYRYNQENLLNALKGWPSSPDLPFWEVRRASILAELGKLDEAERIAETALTEIRSRLKPFSTDCALLSQEGWTMSLLSAIKNNDFNSEIDYRGDYRDRWEKLETYRCDPGSEIESLQSLITGPPPSSRPYQETKTAFDPGWVLVKTNPPGPDIYDFRPAFAFLRMYEEGARPMSCMHVDMRSEAILNAAKWIAPLAPLWSVGAMIRAGKESEIEEWFDRARVATLNQNEVNNLYDQFFTCLDQGIKQMQRRARLTWYSDNVDFSASQAGISANVISLFSFRCSIEQLNTLLTKAMEIYKLISAHQSLSLYTPINSLFRRVLYAMPQSEIQMRMAELLSLPIPCEGGFDPPYCNLLSEPFHCINWLNDTKLPPSFDRSTWSASIENLVRITRFGNKKARKRAILRLCKLHEIKALTGKESAAFSEALWSRIDPVTQLPSETGMRNFALLNYPEPEPGRAISSFRHYLPSIDFPRVVRRSEETEAKSINKAAADDRYFIDWSCSTTPLFMTAWNVDRKYIDWESSEVGRLLTKAIHWWSEEKGELQEKRSYNFQRIGDLVRERFSDLIVLLAEVILPRLPGAADLRTPVLNLLSEMEQAGLCVLPALPMTLFIDSKSADDISGKMRLGLNSLNPEEIQGSIQGVFYWLVHSSRNKLPAAPDDLLEEWVRRVVSRSQPRLDFAIGQLAVVVKRLPELLSENQRDRICIALEYLVRETELSKERGPETSSPIPLEKRINYREVSADLALELYKFYEVKHLPIPRILIDWKELCRTSSLPEIRRVWI